MPEIRKTTREVTTYEVSLSEGDFEALTDILAESRHAAAYQLYQAFGLVLTGDEVRPLAEGDTVRVTVECPPHLSDENTGHTGMVGELLKVDSGGLNYPYRVQKPDGRGVWVHAIEKVEA